MLGTLISVVVGGTLAILLLLILLIFVVSPLSYVIFAALIRPLCRRAAALLAAPLSCSAEPADWALRISSEELRALSVEVSAVNQARGGELTLAERDAWRGLLTEHGARLGALSGVAP